MKGSASLIRSAEQTLEALESRKAVDDHSPTLVYWRDETGEDSCTSDKLRVASSRGCRDVVVSSASLVDRTLNLRS